MNASRFASIAVSVVLLCSPAAEKADAGSAGQFYEYVQWDVFTDTPLTGNQLAVFLQPAGLGDGLMQKIAREMAFSETTFVFPSRNTQTDFHLRIFAPNRELPFAGHPTIGSAFALAAAGRIAAGTPRVVFEQGIGPVAVDLEWHDDELRFAWMHQRRPDFGGIIEDKMSLAAALNLNPRDITPDGLPVQEVSCGSPFLLVPLETRAAVDRVQVDPGAMARVIERAGLARRSIFVFTTEATNDGATAYSRMVGFGDREDPATGSASGPLGAYLVRHGVVSPEAGRSIRSRQGVRMGRPSWISIRIESEGNAISEVLVGGGSVYAGRGEIAVR